jgi:hypothetical protein
MLLFSFKHLEYPGTQCGANNAGIVEKVMQNCAILWPKGAPRKENALISLLYIKLKEVNKGVRLLRLHQKYFHDNVYFSRSFVRISI